MTASPMGINRWRAIPSSDTPYQRLFDVGYWDLVCEKFTLKEPKHQGQIIEIFPADGSYYAELIAIKLTTGQIKVHEIRKVDLRSAAESISANAEERKKGFEVKLRGPRKWSVLDKNQKVIFEDLNSQEEAVQMLEEYVKEIAA
ncbi:MAG: hypothetical protein P8Y45_04800 [Exilibacterium sp.]